MLLRIIITPAPRKHYFHCMGLVLFLSVLPVGFPCWATSEQRHQATSQGAAACGFYPPHLDKNLEATRCFGIFCESPNG